MHTEVLCVLNFVGVVERRYLHRGTRSDTELRLGAQGQDPSRFPQSKLGGLGKFVMLEIGCVKPLAPYTTKC